MHVDHAYYSVAPYSIDNKIEWIDDVDECMSIICLFTQYLLSANYRKNIVLSTRHTSKKI